MPKEKRVFIWNIAQNEYRKHTKSIRRSVTRQTLVRTNKTEQWKRFSRDMEHDFYGLQEMWNFIRGHRNEMREQIGIKQIHKDQWTTYLKQMNHHILTEHLKQHKLYRTN